MWISGHDTGISNFNTLKNIDIKVPVNRKLQLTSGYVFPSETEYWIKGRALFVVHLFACYIWHHSLPLLGSNALLDAQRKHQTVLIYTHAVM